MALYAFLLAILAAAVFGSPAPYVSTVTCSSNNYRPAVCNVQPRTVQLNSVSVVTKLSRSACTLDTSYGLTSDGKGVWVNDGCRAVFRVSGTFTPQRITSIECSSNNYRPNTCQLQEPGTIDELWVVHKLSRSSCTPDVSYGVTSDKRGVWVNDGCRAVFGASLSS